MRYATHTGHLSSRPALPVWDNDLLGLVMPLALPWARAATGLQRVGLLRLVLAQGVKERDRYFLWTPVLVGCGVGVYFILPVEPWSWIGAVAVFAGLLILGLKLCVRRLTTPSLPIWLLALLFVALGFSAAQLRTLRVSAPFLTHRVGPISLQGDMVEVESFTSGSRITLDHLTIAGFSAAETPQRVRLRVRGTGVIPRPGERVSLVAVLEPLAAPSEPGGFDFQRYGFFQQLGAVGFVVGTIRTVDVAADKAMWPVQTWFQALGRSIGERVRQEHDDAAGAVIIALLVGETTGIPATALAAVRDAGLAHLLSISGVHIGMAAGLLFFWTRLLVAAVPWLALRVEPKKVAAAIAIAGATFYAMLSGNSVPTQRSLLMLTVVMIGVFVGRRAISMRLLAWAALVILLTQPDSMLGASFQMSFAAMVALIAAAERNARAPRQAVHDKPRALRRGLVYLAAIVGSSVVATLATAPFAIFHFNRLALLGVVSNLLAIPLTGFWILPWGMLALMLMPFGCENWALAPMSWGTWLLIHIAETAAAVPGAAILLPVLPGWGLTLIALGGLWLCLWQRRWRLAGLVAIAAGMGSMLLVQPPSMLIDGEGKLIGVRLSDGSMAMSRPSGARFARRNWAQRNGEEASTAVWPKAGVLDGGRLRCDPLGCVYRLGTRVVAIPRLATARADDCREADLIVAVDPFPPPCPSAVHVLDRWDLWRNGAHAIWLEPTGIRIETVGDGRRSRPWSRTSAAASPDDDS